eukprot:TRINITY_DN2078_c0_g1_i3.p1 TRINITY_DN2078_c0_g1~~TRINITY_DN2078_c0_g1_i3.p1  ORF type:complete len:179 (-),score=73.87 TRINITY_DN2078_c0_g1_i3:1044-1580(-)
MESESLGCVDLKGSPIPEGHPFSPGPDGCLLCVCSLGRPILCRSALCAPPKNCRLSRENLGGETCCQFYCTDNSSSGGELGLRLVASGITAILSLALLFFLIYRLRQRKRPSSVECSSSSESSSEEGEDGGSLDEPPPPPHWWWGKPAFHQHHPPPSYDEAVYLDPPPAYSEQEPTRI